MLLAVALLFLTACEPSTPEDSPPPEIRGLVVPMVVNATPNDGEVFVSWTPPAGVGSSDYEIYFRAWGTEPWRVSPVATPPSPAPSVLRCVATP